MKIAHLAWLAVPALLLSPVAAVAEITSLTVRVMNISPQSGTVEVTLFNSEESFMKEPYRQQSGKSNETGEFVTEFRDLTSGEYAVVVVHDANDNGKLDSGFLGLGGESYGFSNEASSWFGRPGYEDAKFITAPSGNVVEIDLD
ncbi:DUF2141 domain-containing protein [Pseudomonadota bacterium]